MSYPKAIIRHNAKLHIVNVWGYNERATYDESERDYCGSFAVQLRHKPFENIIVCIHDVVQVNWECNERFKITESDQRRIERPVGVDGYIGPDGEKCKIQRKFGE